MRYPKSEYDFVRFEKSKTEHKKYDAILLNRKTGGLVRVPFGDNRYEQFKDSTGLGLYTSKDHYDFARKKSYWARHKNDIVQNAYSAGMFSLHYLW